MSRTAQPGPSSLQAKEGSTSSRASTRSGDTLYRAHGNVDGERLVLHEGVQQYHGKRKADDGIKMRASKKDRRRSTALRPFNVDIEQVSLAVRLVACTAIGARCICEADWPGEIRVHGCRADQQPERQTRQQPGRAHRSDGVTGHVFLNAIPSLAGSCASCEHTPHGFCRGFPPFETQTWPRMGPPRPVLRSRPDVQPARCAELRSRDLGTLHTWVATGASRGPGTVTAL